MILEKWYYLGADSRDTAARVRQGLARFEVQLGRALGQTH